MSHTLAMRYLKSFALRLQLLVRYLWNVFIGLTRRQNYTPFHCDFCAERFATPQELVNHLWEEHGYPAEVRVNGRVFRSGPSEILDRYFLQRWAVFKNSR